MGLSVDRCSATCQGHHSFRTCRYGERAHLRRTCVCLCACAWAVVLTMVRVRQAALRHTPGSAGLSNVGKPLPRGPHQHTVDMHSQMGAQQAQMMQFEHQQMPMDGGAAGVFGMGGPVGNPYAPPPFGMPPQAPDAGVSHVELELELQLRGNLLVQQQRRIVQLESELQKTWQQMEYLRMQLEAQEQQHKERPVEKKAQSRYWTPEEHARFLEALEKFGPKEVRAISQYVGSRTTTQVRTHAQKFYLKLQKEEKLAAERAARAAQGQDVDAEGAARGAKRRRSRSSRMQMPEDLSSIPRRDSSRPKPVPAAASASAGAGAGAAAAAAAAAAAGAATSAGAGADTSAGASAASAGTGVDTSARASSAVATPQKPSPAVSAAPVSATTSPAPAVSTPQSEAASSAPPSGANSGKASPNSVQLNSVKVDMDVPMSSGTATAVRPSPAAATAEPAPPAASASPPS